MSSAVRKKKMWGVFSPKGALVDVSSAKEAREHGYLHDSILRGYYAAPVLVTWQSPKASKRRK